MPYGLCCNDLTQPLWCGGSHRVESVFSPVCEIPAVKPCQPSKPEVLGTPPLDARPLGWGPGMGLRALTPVGKCLHYNYSPVCGLPIRMAWGLIIS